MVRLFSLTALATGFQGNAASRHAPAEAGAYTQELVGRAITLVRLGSQCIRIPTKLRGENENTAKPEKCARDRPIHGDPGPDLCAGACAVGEGSCTRNPARPRRQAESLGAGSTIARWSPGPVRNLATQREQVRSQHCSGPQSC